MVGTILITLSIIFLLGAGYVLLVKNDKIKDSDGDYIPDVVEDKVETTIEDIKEELDEVKAKVKARVKKAKAEAVDVKDTLKKAADEAGDVVDALLGKVVIDGKVTKTKLRELSKEDLASYAKQEFNVEVDVSNKTKAVNEVYKLKYPNKK